MANKISRLIGWLGLVSSLVLVWLSISVLWNAPPSFIPEWAIWPYSTNPEAIEDDVFKMAIISLLYLAIQAAAAAGRNPGNIWGQAADFIFSLLPVVSIAIPAFDETFEFTKFQSEVSYMFFIAVAADVVIIFILLYKAALFANDFVSR